MTGSSAKAATDKLGGLRQRTGQTVRPRLLATTTNKMLGGTHAVQAVLALASWLGLSVSDSHTHSSHTLLPGDLVKTLDRYRENYGVRGASLSVVTSPVFSGKGWHEEVYSFGEADHKGNKVTEEVGQAALG